MKKIFTLITMTLISLTAMANDYTDKLTVTVNGVSSEQMATITVEKEENGLYTFSLKNFCLESTDDDGNATRIGVGNIVLSDREGTTADGVTTITFDGNITIAEGDDPNVAFWMGPMIGEVPIAMEARFNDEQLYCEIHIDLMATLEQMVEVTFGTDFNLGVELKKAETTAPAAFFTLGGQRISTPQRGQVVIERKSNGQTVKRVANK